MTFLHDQLEKKIMTFVDKYILLHFVTNSTSISPPPSMTQENNSLLYKVNRKSKWTRYFSLMMNIIYPPYSPPNIVSSDASYVSTDKKKMKLFHEQLTKAFMLVSPITLQKKLVYHLRHEESFWYWITIKEKMPAVKRRSLWMMTTNDGWLDGICFRNNSFSFAHLVF